MVFLSAYAVAQDSYAASTDERLDKLEEQISILEKEIFDKDNEPAAKATKEAKASTRAMFEVRISTLEEQVRLLTGKVEKIEFVNHQLHKKLDKTRNELIVKLNEIKETVEFINKENNEEKEKLLGAMQQLKSYKEKNKKAVEKVKKEPSLKTAKEEIEKKAPEKKKIESVVNTEQLLSILQKGKPENSSSIRPENDYDEAFSILKEGKYNLAAEKFLEFIKQNPEHKLVSNSYYWIGESFYAKDEFKKASVYFLQSYEHDKKGNKAQDSLLKLAMSLGRTGKKEEACTTFLTLSENFPDIKTAIKQRMEKEKNLFSCN